MISILNSNMSGGDLFDIPVGLTLANSLLSQTSGNTLSYICDYKDETSCDTTDVSKLISGHISRFDIDGLVISSNILTHNGVKSPTNTCGPSEVVLQGDVFIMFKYKRKPLSNKHIESVQSWDVVESFVCVDVEAIADFFTKNDKLFEEVSQMIFVYQMSEVIIVNMDNSLPFYAAKFTNGNQHWLFMSQSLLSFNYVINSAKYEHRKLYMPISTLGVIRLSPGFNYGPGIDDIALIDMEGKA